jgi:hypothetical protein
MSIIDTTDRSVSDCAAVVHQWIRREIAEP